jgi:hypothetical protein
MYRDIWRGIVTVLQYCCKLYNTELWRENIETDVCRMKERVDWYIPVGRCQSSVTQ